MIFLVVGWGGVRWFGGVRGCGRVEVDLAELTVMGAGLNWQWWRWWWWSDGLGAVFDGA